MSVKHLTIPVFAVLFLSSCGSQVEVREYVEVVQLPQQSRMMPPQVATPTDPMRAAPLSVAPTMDNLPADHPSLEGMHPPMGAAGANVMAGREGEVPAAPVVDDVAWELPPGWESKAGSGMRIAEFYPEPDKPQALVTLIALSGSAGSMPANISRWRGQVGLNPTTEMDITHLDGKQHFEFITFVDESISLGKEQTIIAAIYQQPSRTLFLKFMGPTDIVAAHKLDFLQLAGSLDEKGAGQ
ncbi:hypothetical protein P3T73_10530 [Kiritimatiellota bacterium B12222]|nr:hypothetical protein P3T73_10530 [Kiritimatiellota bacterium B12222]